MTFVAHGSPDERLDQWSRNPGRRPFPTAAPMSFFNRFGFWFLMQVILFVDVLIFTVGYLVESRRLGNEIRSVDPTIVGWAAALGVLSANQSVDRTGYSDQPLPFSAVRKSDAALDVEPVAPDSDGNLRECLGSLGAQGQQLDASRNRSAWSVFGSEAPGLRMQEHGVVDRAAPVVTAAFDQALFNGLLALGSVFAWTMLYFLRAVTEDHLRGVDSEYADYAAKVRYRFIPGLI